MGGSKAELAWGEHRLLDHMVALLLPTAAEVLVAVRAGQHLDAAVGPLTDPAVRLVPDSIAAAGPLAGIAAGLTAARSEVVVTVAVDLPLLRPAVLGVIAAALQPPPEPSVGGGSAAAVAAGAAPPDIALPMVDGRAQPLLAAYRRSTVLPVAERLLAAGRRAVLALTDELRVTALPPQAFADVDPALESFRNVNIPDDLAAARTIFLARGGG